MSSITSHHRSVATFIHLATFTKYLVPLGNFIFPLLLWTAQRKESHFVDEHGRRTINFQISMFIYNICAVLISLPFIAWQVINLVELNAPYDFDDDFDTVWNFFQVSGLVITAIVLGTVLIALFIIELIAVITAAIRANSGESYNYPLSISFIKSSGTATYTNDPDSSTGPVN